MNNVNSKIDDYNNARPHKEGVTIFITAAIDMHTEIESDWTFQNVLMIGILLTYTSQSCAGKNYSRHNTFTHDDFI